MLLSLEPLPKPKFRLLHWISIIIINITKKIIIKFNKRMRLMITPSMVILRLLENTSMRSQ